MPLAKVIVTIVVVFAFAVPLLIEGPFASGVEFDTVVICELVVWLLSKLPKKETSFPDVATAGIFQW